ncbi:MAG: alpha/beta hydrolase-fold protein [Bacteroidales bacterium]
MKKHLSFKHGKQLFFLMSLLTATLLDASSQDQVTKPDVKTYPPVSVPNTELRTFYSSILNQEMNIYIKLPISYYNNTQKVYPAWYFTDANRSFPMVANMVSIFEVPRLVEPEIIVIGIGYKIKDLADWGAWRTRDLTPTNIPALDTTWAKMLTGMTGRQFVVKSGGAATFLEFIVKEVFPFVESNYRVSPTGRGIGGYSYGGLFSLYVLFKHSELFSIYYAGSPSIDYDKGVLFNFEKEYASTHKDLNAKLFMSAGTSEDTMMVTNMKKMADLMQSRNYPGLTVETHVFPGETHESCYPSSIMRALRVLYNR